MKEKILQILKPNSKLYFIAKIITTLLFSLTIVLDKMIVFNGDVHSKYTELYFSTFKASYILYFVLIFIFTYLILSALEVLADKIETTIYTKKQRKVKNIKVFFIVWLIILLCWLPTILSYFPGGIFADTAISISQAIKEQPINNHHPILYTILIKIFIDIANIFSSTQLQAIQLGMKLFTVWQVIAMSLTCAYTIYWSYKKQISSKYLVLITAFFGIFKLIPLYAISIWKDTPFCIALFLYIIFIAEIVCTNGKNLEKLKGIITYVLLLTLVAFLRNNGIYIVTLTTIILLIAYRKNICKNLKEFTIIAIVQMIICFIIQGPVYKHYGISTEFVESVGVPVQQICYVIANEGNITETQEKFINNICPIETIKAEYTPGVVDHIKWNGKFNNSYLEENKIQFIKVWIKMFIQNPKAYVEAYLLNTMGFWNINKSTEDLYVNNRMWANPDEFIGVKQNDYIKEMTNISIRNIVGNNNTISSAMFLMIMIISMMICIYKKRYKNLLIYIPALATWITIMIAVPVAFGLRYVYILVLMIPLSLIVPFLKPERSQAKSEEKMQRKVEE